MKVIETRAQTFARVMNRIRRYIEKDTVEAMQAIREAKQKELWKEKYSSWKECCEMEFGRSRRRVYQLLEIAETIEDIQSVQPLHTESGKNKEILANLSTRQVAELKGLPPEKKAEVLARAIEADGGQSPRPSTIARLRSAAKLPPRRSSFDPDERPRDNSNAYVSESPKIRPTKADMATAKDFGAYPKTIVVPKLTVKNEEEEAEVRALILKYGNDTSTELNKKVHTCIARMSQVYKEKKGEELSGIRSGVSVGQIRNLIEEQGLDSVERIIEVFSKGLKLDSFWAKRCNNVPSFVKFYGEIRDQVDNPNPIGRAGQQSKSPAPDHSKGW